MSSIRKQKSNKKPAEAGFSFCFRLGPAAITTIGRRVSQAPLFWLRFGLLGHIGRGVGNAALVDDLLGAAVAGSDDLAFSFLHLFVRNDVQREGFYAICLDLRFDLGLEFLARLHLRKGRRSNQHRRSYRDKALHPTSPFLL